MADAKTQELTAEELQAKLDRLAQLEKENQGLKSELETATTTITEQAQQLSEAEATVAASPAVYVTHEAIDGEGKSKKVKYQVLCQQFQVKGEVVKAADLHKNKELIAALVEGGSGLLKKVK